LAPRARWRERVVAYGRVASEPTAAPTPRDPGLRRHRGHARAARLDLGGPHAPGIRHRCFGVCPLWGPAAPDRYPPRPRRHPEDPRAPGPRPLGAESRPRPTHARRRRALIAPSRGARAASLPPLTIRPDPPGPSGRCLDALTPTLRPATIPLSSPGALGSRGGRLCALCLRLQRPISVPLQPRAPALPGPPRHARHRPHEVHDSLNPGAARPRIQRPAT
jgi:hypothetical protein